MAIVLSPFESSAIPRTMRERGRRKVAGLEAPRFFAAL